MTDPTPPPIRCRFVIIKRYKGLRYDHWRRQCSRMVGDGEPLCWQHRPAQSVKEIDR